VGHHLQHFEMALLSDIIVLHMIGDVYEMLWIMVRLKTEAMAPLESMLDTALPMYWVGSIARWARVG